MKIAVLCPLGPMDRYGYQYNFMTTISSYSEFADRVYLYSSSRNRTNIEKILAAFPNVVYISDERTWFSFDDQGNEFFRVSDFERNNDVALGLAKEDGMDAAVHIHINQYIERESAPLIKSAMEKMLSEGRPFEWLYRRYQLSDTLFHADTRHPWMLNLSIKNPFVLRADAIQNIETGERYMMEHSDYREYDLDAVRDAGMEMTLQDLADVRNFTRGYVEMNPNANPKFDWDVYKAYYTEKFSNKKISPAKPGFFGRQIARSNQRDFLSNYLVSMLNSGSGNKLFLMIKKAFSR